MFGREWLNSTNHVKCDMLQRRAHAATAHHHDRPRLGEQRIKGRHSPLFTSQYDIHVQSAPSVSCERHFKIGCCPVLTCRTTHRQITHHLARDDGLLFIVNVMPYFGNRITVFILPILSLVVNNKWSLIMASSGIV